MVSTRRSGATEPLERLETPPKRTRKPRIPTVPVIREVQVKVRRTYQVSPETVQKVAPRDSASVAVKAIRNVKSIRRDLTCVPVTSNSNTNTNTASTKRRHDEVESLTETPSKRSRTDTASNDDYLLMFPKKSSAEQSDLADPPKTLADSFRRSRQLNAYNRRPGKFSSLPRQRTPLRMHGESPFGIETFSKQELADQANKAVSQENTEPSQEGEERKERSAAPEPETPRRGLFGSLRNVGSATIGRVFSSFGRASGQQSTSPPQPRTEPVKRIAAQDIFYPEVQPLEIEDSVPQQERGQVQADEAGSRSSRKYDELHEKLNRVGPGSQRVAERQSVAPLNPDPEANSAAFEAFANRRREKRQLSSGDKAKSAPLFGPNSHFVRGTKDPQDQLFFEDGDHPALRKSAGSKRSFTEALPEEAAQAQQSSRSFQPHMEDDEDDDYPDSAQDAPSTPVNKKQKLLEKSALQTPRSALKAPGSIGRSGRSARFNDNPVASVKRMSPISGSAPAGSPSANNLFQTFTSSQDTSPSTSNLTPSPNTHKNTLANTGKQNRDDVLFKQHPGDLLTRAMNDATPSELRGTRLPYVWKDPQDPNWKPSLFNPRPGTFRFLADLERDDDDDDDAEQLGMTLPDLPSTPKMSHAELPKFSSDGAVPIDSTSAFEAANLERRRADATKTKPRKGSRLAEVTSAISRSPSPPDLDSDAAEASDESAKTPSPVIGPDADIWTWDATTNEYISSMPKYPDFAYNAQNELIPSFAIKTSSGDWDNTVKGPDGMTELARQNFYKSKYDDAWAAEFFKFDSPQTYEESGVGSKFIHDLIRASDARFPDIVKKSDARFVLEWDAHQQAIEEAMREGKELVATFPDRDGVEMLDADEEL